MGTIWGSETKGEAGAGAALRTGKPGQAAQAESTQRVFGTHRIGANPEKLDLVNLRGPDWK